MVEYTANAAFQSNYTRSLYNCDLYLSVDHNSDEEEELYDQKEALSPLSLTGLTEAGSQLLTKPFRKPKGQYSHLVFCTQLIDPLSKKHLLTETLAQANATQHSHAVTTSQVYSFNIFAFDLT
jgi:hypothetical protein